MSGCGRVKSIFVSVLAIGLALNGAKAGQAMRVIAGRETGVKLLRNGGFEDSATNGTTWSGWHQGFEWAPRAGRGGSHAIRCSRKEGQDEFGASQMLALNRTNVAPFVIRGWSKAANVSGSPDNGYSLYVDITYMDGTPLWGRTAPFTCGTHDWEHREFVVLPEKPVKNITLHCLFRGHTGDVWFDDVSLEEIPAPAGATFLHGTPVSLDGDQPGGRGKPARSIVSGDGLSLGLSDGRVASLRVSGNEFSATSPSGFLARDFKAGSDYFGFENGVCPELGLRIESEVLSRSNHILVSGRVIENRKQDRAVTVLFALPLDPEGWSWGEDARQSRRVEGQSEFVNTVSVRSGAAQRMSRYPFGCIWNESAGLGIGIDMDCPAQYTIGFNSGTRQFFVAYDFGISADTKKFPNEARFKFVVFRFDPGWGFRGALQKYYEIFPDQFTKRVKQEGVWMPFTDIARVPEHKDFGFAFQEGAPNVRFDDANGIYSFYYVEPMSHWLALPAGCPRTYAAAVEVLRENLAGKDAEQRRMGAATFSSGIQDKEGQFALYLVKAPWCDGGVFTLNPDPDVPTNSATPWNKASVMRHAIEDAFRNNAPKENASAPDAGLDGVYLDSLEMSASELNYRRDHFGGADVPLVFDPEGRVCQLMIFNTWEFARATALDMHARHKLMFANGALWSFSFPAPLLDVLGTEVNWMREGRYSPDSDAVMNFRRAMSRQKPYCLLMNTDYRKFTPEIVERYFERCIFYGVWPGFFDEEAASKDPYWASKSAWYERDRKTFKRYIPLLRKVTAAGWEPVTLARADNPAMWIERFGKADGRDCCLAVHNSSDSPQEGIIVPDAGLRELSSRKEVQDLVTGEKCPRSDKGWRVRLKPYQTALFN